MSRRARPLVPVTKASQDSPSGSRQASQAGTNSSSRHAAFEFTKNYEFTILTRECGAPRRLNRVVSEKCRSTRRSTADRRIKEGPLIASSH